MFKSLRSLKSVIPVLILAFSLFSASDGINALSMQQQSSGVLLKKGIDLYESGKYEEAIQTLNQAAEIATQDQEKSDIYLFLAASHHYIGNNSECEQNLVNAVQFQPDRIIDDSYFSSAFVKLYNAQKIEYEKAAELAAPDKQSPRPRVKVKVDPNKGVRRTSNAAYYVFGVLAIVGGIAAMTLIPDAEEPSETGTLKVESDPSGADVYVNGEKRGVTTLFLPGVPVGTHTIRIAKVGYADRTQEVRISAWQTTNVVETLNQYTIKVTSPSLSTTWMKGEQVSIRWSIGESSGPDLGLLMGKSASDSLNNILSRSRFSHLRGLSSGFSSSFRIKSRRAEQQKRIVQIQKGISQAQKAVKSGTGRSPSSRIPILGGRFTPLSPSNQGNPDPSLRNQGRDDLQERTALQDISAVDIRLITPDNVESDIAKAVPASDLSYSWTVSHYVLADEGYRIEITSVDDQNIVGTSAEFKIIDSYQFSGRWGSEALTGEKQLKSPHGIAVDSAGNIYISDTENHRISKYDGDGKHIVNWGSQGDGLEQFSNPQGLDIDNQGNVFIADTDNHRIVKIGPAGGFFSWGTRGKGKYAFLSPEDVAVDSEGYVYVADTGNHRIVKYNQSLQFEDSWGTYGWNTRQFRSPSGIAVDSQGMLYIADLERNRIAIYTSEGKYQKEITRYQRNPGAYWSSYTYFNRPSSVAVDAERNIYIVQNNRKTIVKLNAQGTWRAEWGLSGAEEGRLGDPVDIAAGPSGRIYVVDKEKTLALKYSNTGTYMGKIGNNQLLDKQFNFPQGMAATPMGDILVADTGDNRVTMYTSSGVPKSPLGDGTLSLDSGIFDKPVDVAMDGGGSMYVVDYENKRIVHFKPDGSYEPFGSGGGAALNQFADPTGIAIDRRGILYVSDKGNRRIVKFRASTHNAIEELRSSHFQNPTGVAVDERGNIYISDESEGVVKLNNQGQFVQSFNDGSVFNRPQGITLDQDGYVYVADTDNHRIKKYTSEGDLLAVWGSQGSDNTQFNKPHDVAVDSSGNVYVADSGNHRIVKYRYLGAAQTGMGSKTSEPAVTSRSPKPNSKSTADRRSDRKAKTIKKGGKH